MDNPDFSKIDRWLEQAAKEIVLSEPGTDRSQFPLRDLFASIAEKSEGVDGLGAFHECATHATACIEEILFSGQPYTVEQLDMLNALTEQLEQLRNDPSLAYVAPTATDASGSAPVPASETSRPASAADEDSFGPSDDEEYALADFAKDGDLLREFAQESREHLENIEQGVLILEEQPGDADTLNSIFRAFHTFKGGSGFLHLVPVNRLSHELESLLDSAREGRLAITSPIIDLILESSDVLKSFLDELQLQIDCKKPVAPIHVPGTALIARARAILANPQAAAELAASASTSTQEARGPASECGPRAAAVATSSVIKVNTQKFDTLVDLVGELVIAQSLVAQDPTLQVRSPQLTRNMAQLHRITNELQKTAMSLRMVPIRGTFQKMNRLVRDLAARNGKQIDLELVGEDTEMDRTIVEELADPLMHMIRNSVDHGVESPEKREAAGKSREGRITLSATHQGGNIVIEIADDGAGLSAAKLHAKAVERGIIASDAQLSEKETFDLIFAAGFSTAEKVTDISGRGVGMDVVKRNISKLRGKIEIQSTPGRGTTFKIYLPLTLAIIDGLVVRVGDQRYIIPTLSVRESFRPTPDMLSTVCKRGEMVNVRGKLRPMLRLHDYFSVEPRTTNPCESLVIVVESAHEERCVLVDDLLGQQEVVIKSLGDHFKNNRALAGAAILGDGRVGLILEPRSLVQIEHADALAA
jgi:two-component system chemotaxis sensor kinase CheA